MRRPTLLFLAACVATAAFSQKMDDGMHRYSLDFTLSAVNFVDTIPIVAEGDQIYIPVTINGRQHLFNLDTGSSQGVVYQGGTVAYGLPVGKVNSRDANGRIDTIPAVRFPTFQLGRLTVSGYTGSLLSRPPGRYPYDAIIGFDLFNKGLQGKIDLRRKQLILTDRKDFFAAEPGFVMKYKLKRWVPYVKTNPFLKYKEETLFDTGSQELYAMNKGAFDRERFKDVRVANMIEDVEEGQSAIGNYGAERSGQVIYMQFPELPWGDFRFLNVHAHTTQGDTRIGTQLLNYGTLVVDPKQKELKFQPYPAEEGMAMPLQVEADNKLADIAYIPTQDGRAMVGLVRRGTPAHANGFRQGDIILRINDDAIASFDDFKSYPFVKGRRYVFTLLSARGFKKEIAVDNWGIR